MVTFDIYVRKSTVTPDQRSVQSQDEECRRDLHEQHHAVGIVFSEEISASRFARQKRDEFPLLMARLRAGECEGVCLWESSRGSRTLSEWAVFLEVCRDLAVPIRVTTHQRTYDVRIRRDWKTLAEEGVDSQDESERLSERSRRGKRQRAYNGLPDGMLKYGFTRVYDDHGRFVEQIPHPEQAPIVREFVRRLVAGESAAEIARDLNDRGVPTMKGLRWAGPTITRMARSPAYFALRTLHGRVIGPAKWEPLISEDQYHAVVALLTDPKRRTAKTNQLSWELSGFATCGPCGQPLRPRQGRTRRGETFPTYGCTPNGCVTVRADEFESLVEAMVFARLRDVDPEELFGGDGENRGLAEARSEERALLMRRKEHIDLSIAGRIDAATLAEVLAGLAPQIEAAAERVKTLQRRPVLRDLASVDIEAGWRELSAEVRRTVIRAVCEVVVVDRAPYRGYPKFEKNRVGRSKFHGEERTWSQLWAAAEAD
jgi:site-specific DNA recombinase